MKSILFLLFIFVFYSSAYAEDSDLYYFNGVKWGSVLKAGGNFKLKATGIHGDKYYARIADKSMYKGIPVKEVRYNTKNGRFTDANFIFIGGDAYNKVRSALAKSFMKSERIDDTHILYRIYNGKRFVNAMVNYSQGQGLVNFHFSGEREHNQALKDLESLK